MCREYYQHVAAASCAFFQGVAVSPQLAPHANLD